MKKAPTFLSLKDLVEGKFYRVEAFEHVTTAKGERIRLKLSDTSFVDKIAYVHLPERLLHHILPKIEKLNLKCQSKKPIFLVYKGLRGKAFDLRFTGKPH